jgi:NAD kinase
MKYTEKEIQEMVKKLSSYERIINRMLLKFHKMERKKMKEPFYEECVIHLSFSGLNKVMSLKDDDKS